MFYFPTYLATGNAFCNRTEELKRTIYDLNNGIPVLLMSPRRYGKTSLALRAIEALRYPYADIDLFKACTEEDIARFILAGIGQLLGKIENTPKKLLALAAEFFAHLSVRVALESNGLVLDFNKNEINATELIFNALKKLQLLCAKKNKRVILFFDEFQMIGEVASQHALEAILREAAQKFKNILFIFSGNNRHLMEQIFFDKKRPFYKLCDTIKLHRISEEHYLHHINAAAKSTWKKHINEEHILHILMLTERHPYYVNKLCSLLWQDNQPPSEKSIYNTWHHFVLENKSIIERELLLLPPSQRKLLINIAENENIRSLFTKDFLLKTNLSQGGIQKALLHLLKMDYVFQNEMGEYHIVDPLIKNVLTVRQND